MGAVALGGWWLGGETVSGEPLPSARRPPPLPRFSDLNFCVGMSDTQWRFKDQPAASAYFATPFVWSVASNAPDQEAVIAEMEDWLEQARPGLVIGRYFSATTTPTDGRRHTPHWYVPIELLGRRALLPESYPNDPSRRFIDLRKESVRRKMVRHIVETAVASGRTAVSLDNVTQGYNILQSVAPAEWDAAQRSLLTELRRACHRESLLFIVNASIHLAVFATGWDGLLPLVDGLLWEMPMHPYTMGAPERVDAELQAYRRVLDAGKFVGLVPLGDTSEERERNERLCAAAAMLARQFGEPMAVAPRSYAPVLRDWFDWPEALGVPEGDYGVNGTVFHREFIGGSVTMNIADSSVDVQFK
jgi:hypothetical protein